MNTDNIHLLLIEDDIVDQLAFKRMVKSKNLPYSYKIANSVLTAKEILSQENFDVVITDYDLGDGTAFDIFELIVDTPFIFTTGAGDEKIAVEAMKSGAFYYHIKDADRNYLELLPVSINKALKEKYLEKLQKQAEIDLKESESKFRTISSAANDAIIVMDYEGTVQFWNRAAEKIFGYSRKEITGKNLDDLIVPEDANFYFLKGLKYHWEKGINSALGERVEMTARKKSGEFIFVELSISAVKLKDQLNSILVIRDITVQKESKEQLRQSKERLDIILHNIGNGVVAVDCDLKILFANNKTFTLLGFLNKPEEINDLHSLLVNCKNKGITLVNSLEKESFRNLELTVVKPLQRVMYVTATPYKDMNDKTAGKIFILADVTREKEIERMKTDFVSSVTHELRTPITSIKGFTKTMLMNNNLSENNKLEFLEIIFKESNRLESLIEDVLSIAKIESGKVSYKFKKISLAPVIEHVYNIFKMQAAKKDIILTCEIAEGLPQISADQDAIHQVAVNLIGNALKFTTQGGEIKVKLYSENNQLVFRISDNGLGIPLADQKNIFKKFYRVRRPGTEIPGTGLGLSIVQEIVSKHRGKIEMESKENAGTTFSVFFPITENQIS
ncbi:MAG: hypothetical protein APR54_08060 [Candidatus Cloacimonas sp. SDB]|nr:MAG: hypothetical protein APR54_08060 [Candidatus Cloacimonas sp. SDB]